jgi:F-type H+-transporting ATPase subunit epsilon
VSERIFVAGGFAEVTPERCTVLAEEAERLDEIDRAAVEGQIRILREDLGMAQSEDERALIEGRIAVAEAKIDAIGDTVYQ